MVFGSTLLATANDHRVLRVISLITASVLDGATHAFGELGLAPVQVQLALLHDASRVVADAIA